MANRDDDLDPTDPVEAFLAAAPDDDEPFTDEDRAAAGAGWQAYLRGESSSLDEVRRRLLGDALMGGCSHASSSDRQGQDGSTRGKGERP